LSEAVGVTFHEQFVQSLGVNLYTSAIVGNGFDPNGANMPWMATVQSVPDLVVESLIKEALIGGTFESDGSEWTIVGDGTFDIVASPNGEGMAGRLTTETEVSISQLIDTPAEPFVLTLDQLFTSVAGSAQVSLGGVLLGEEFAASSSGSFDLSAMLVADAALLGQAGIELKITVFGGSTGQFVFDNISIASGVVPEPSSVLLALAAVSLFVAL
jgi:hypothetical protein